MSNNNVNDFKSSFRFYKQKQCNYFEEVTFYHENVEKCILKGKLRLSHVTHTSSAVFGVKKSDEWKLYELSECPGLILIKNCFTSLGQRYWITRCLLDFPKKPNKRNIDIENNLKDVDNFWLYCLRNDFKLIDKLRWSTLGYHHNWDSKIYSEGRKGDFPNDLDALSQHFAASLGYSNYKAEAAIINMYHPGSNLSGHVDKSEVDLEAPLLSFSFGQPAIFLIGGKTLDSPATAILLESGDVMLMSQAARLCYHGVPRILSTHLRPWENIEECPEVCGLSSDVMSIIENEELWRPFGQYVSRSRINMNVRQVLPHGIQTLTEVDSTKGN